MLAMYGSTTDRTLLHEVYHDLAELITTAPVDDEYIMQLRAILDAPATAAHTEQLEAFIALCMDYRYLLANMH